MHLLILMIVILKLLGKWNNVGTFAQHKLLQGAPEATQPLSICCVDELQVWPPVVEEAAALPVSQSMSSLLAR